jgi:hypothetical protein
MFAIHDAGAKPMLPPRPASWPATLQIGMIDPPGDAARLRMSVPLGFRYAYLAGGVNTGSGWSTWSPDGSYVSSYVLESRAVGMIPVFSYYMLVQSKPGDVSERESDLRNLQDPATMAAYWADVRLFFKRAQGSGPVVLHVEPDLWGYIQQAAKADNAATVPVVVPDGLPQTAAGFAQEFVRLRDRLASNVLLAWHLSEWGTGHDIVDEDPSNALVGAYAVRSARFYRSLHAPFDLSFEDFSDRDSGYSEVRGQRGRWFAPADFRRHLLFGQTFVQTARLRMVAWQIPLGNTLMRAMDNTWGHYQDNRVQWLLTNRTHLRAYAAAGYIGFLFGGGATGTTCACDGRRDGITNPAPINDNTRRSLSADDDGGLFRSLARAYSRKGPLRLP